ncbi:hypothetical protein ACFT9I_06215 [Streptomyces sp. NPDC057137]|uniref:hypothetical protein n=1 Tax=Streptomyces sp. NPDC057137 TaxID=3346030 RepID=UPI0036357D7B
MTMLAPGSTTFGLKLLCWSLMPKTAVRCTHLDPLHQGDHSNPYVGAHGATWPRTPKDRK